MEGVGKCIGVWERYVGEERGDVGVWKSVGGGVCSFPYLPHTSPYLPSLPPKPQHTSHTSSYTLMHYKRRPISNV